MSTKKKDLVADELRKAAAALGKKGGAVTAKRGAEFYKKIGRKGNKAQGNKV